jgi:hypothetical protein
LLGRLTRIAAETVLTFYAAREREEGWARGQEQIALDGTWGEKDGELAWEGLGDTRGCCRSGRVGLSFGVGVPLIGPR